MKKLTSLFAILALALAAGCHAQVPQPTAAPVISLTWTAASTCGGSNPACTYVVSRATCPTATTCPANTSGNTAFTALNATAPVSGLTYTDSTPPAGALVIYTATTVQAFSGCPTGGCISQPSGPSNSGTPLSVPPSPTAPAAPNASETAELNQPGSVEPVIANSKEPAPGVLVAKLVR
jgi:hypothetical protein